MRYAFTCSCKCLFEGYCKEEIKANCPLCGSEVLNAICMDRGHIKPNLTVISDTEPYRSPIDGSIISSRSRHRDHMREHNVVEMGNEYPKAREIDRAPLPRAGYDIVRSLEASR